RLVDWNDVDSAFERLPDLAIPWRWKTTNPDLGDWLLSIRPGLLNGSRPDFGTGPVDVRGFSDAAQVLACGERIKDTSVVAIRKWPNDAHNVASKLGGNFTSMEEMESKDLLAHARAIGSCDGRDRALRVIAFAKVCVTQVGKHLKTAEDRFKAG